MARDDRARRDDEAPEGLVRPTKLRWWKVVPIGIAVGVLAWLVWNGYGQPLMQRITAHPREIHRPSKPASRGDGFAAGAPRSWCEQAYAIHQSNPAFFGAASLSSMRENGCSRFGIPPGG